jgi:metal-responsive CopG/Arc/MetJ family transcriptional regulator
MTSNVLPVARPAGSGRPNKGRKLISVWIAETGIAELDRIANEQGCNRSDVLRLALKHGLANAERELRKGQK